MYPRIWYLTQINSCSNCIKVIVQVCFCSPNEWAPKFVKKHFSVVQTAHKSWRGRCGNVTQVMGWLLNVCRTLFGSMWFLILFMFEIFSRWCRVCMPEVSKNATDSSYYSWSLWTCFNSKSKFELMSTKPFFFYFNSTFVPDVWSSQMINKEHFQMRAVKSVGQGSEGSILWLFVLSDIQ